MAQTKTNNGTKVRWVARRNVKAQNKWNEGTNIAMVFCELENGHKFTVAIPEQKIAFMAGVHPTPTEQQVAENGVIESEVQLAAVREVTK
jgi:hypothetical protein